MGLVLVLSAAGLLLLPGCARRWGRRLCPREWAWLCAAALAAGLVLFELTAVLLAAPTVLRAAGVSRAALLCERMLGALAPGGALAGWTAAAVAAVVPALAGVAWVRSRRALRTLRIEPSLGQHHRRGSIDIVVLPTPRLLAASRGGSDPQVLLSDGLVAALDPAELAAVVRHEMAHLRHRHDRFLLLATMVEHSFVGLPLIRRSTAALRAALERWADEEAATDGAGRIGLRLALRKVTELLIASPAAAFSDADTVLERLDALAHDPPAPHALLHLSLYAPGMILGVAALVALSDRVSRAHMVVAVAGQCVV